MFWTRFKSVLVFIPLMLIMIFWGGIPFQIFILAILTFAGWEYWRLIKTIGFKTSLVIILAGILLLTIHRIIFGIKYADVLVSGIVFLLALYSLIRYERGQMDSFLHFCLHVGAILYLGWVGSFFISLRSINNSIDGKFWLLTALPITWLVDLGAYTIGKPWGKHKMFPRLSPKKSWEGYLGGIVFGVIAGLLLSLLWKSYLPALSLWKGAIMGLVLGMLTPVGDLFVSLLKRTAGTKDTGNIIPGHGGVLDRIDTWIWSSLIAYYLIQIFANL